MYTKTSSFHRGREISGLTINKFIGGKFRKTMVENPLRSPGPRHSRALKLVGLVLRLHPLGEFGKIKSKFVHDFYPFAKRSSRARVNMRSGEN